MVHRANLILPVLPIVLLEAVRATLRAGGNATRRVRVMQFRVALLQALLAIALGCARFIAYYRVSTDRQGKSGLGLEAQRKAILDYLDGGAWATSA